MGSDKIHSREANKREAAALERLDFQRVEGCVGVWAHYRNHATIELRKTREGWQYWVGTPQGEALPYGVSMPLESALFHASFQDGRFYQEGML